jgi:FAD:protein FMN transferase
MPLVETLPRGVGCTQWDIWGTVARIVVTDPDRLDDATAIVRAELAAVDEACSRFRPDSEVRYAAQVGGRPVRVSARLIELVTTALTAARDTDGDVDPTMGATLSALGYDRDFIAIPTTVAGMRIAVHTTATWLDIGIDGSDLTVPVGMQLDLGATAKAWAADRCAALVARRCATGVLVALGGDIATAGPAPDGWRILVHDGAGEPACTITLPSGAALATSSTISRTWRAGERNLHHILNPHTGQPASRAWRTASVAAHSCVAANTLSTAAIVRGARTPRWLRDLGAPARLVAADGTVTTLGSWPHEASRPREMSAT